MWRWEKLGAVRKAALITSLAASCPTWAADKPSKIEQQYLVQIARPSTEVEALIAVQGDAMDPQIKVSTMGATQVVSRGWVASQVYENSFLRAFIDKASGKVSAQIYHSARYSGRGWNFFNRATYQTTGGLKEVDVDRVGSDVSCGRYGCTYYEDVVVPVDLDVLRNFAAGSEPLLRYRLFGQSGETIDEALPHNEVAAFVAVVDRQRPALQAPTQN